MAEAGALRATCQRLPADRRRDGCAVPGTGAGRRVGALNPGAEGEPVDENSPGRGCAPSGPRCRACWPIPAGGGAAGPGERRRYRRHRQPGAVTDRGGRQRRYRGQPAGPAGRAGPGGTAARRGRLRAVGSQRRAYPRGTAGGRSRRPADRAGSPAGRGPLTPEAAPARVGADCGCRGARRVQPRPASRATKPSSHRHPRRVIRAEQLSCCTDMARQFLERIMPADSRAIFIRRQPWTSGQLRRSAKRWPARCSGAC